jgi:hypothetical protein
MVYRLTLFSLVRNLGRWVSPTDRLEVARKRERLQIRIDAFHRQAAEFWCPEILDDPLEQFDDWVEQEMDPSDSEDTDQPKDVFQTSPSDDRAAPERQQLLLPSYLGRDVCDKQGYSNFAHKEKMLRMGQANDALQGLRLALSRKSVIYREGVRTAKTKTRKLRSWDQIQMVDTNARHHARVYVRARSALLNLGASPEELDRYQVLEKEHMNVRTARIDPSLRGQRDSSLAWFWTMDVKKDIEHGNGMAECEFVSINSTLVNIEKEKKITKFIEFIG